MAIVNLRPPMGNPFDIEAYTPDRQLILIVEVKSADEDESRATFFRRNLVEHELLSRRPYFLLVNAENMYLWLPDQPADSKPNYKAMSRPVFQRLLGHEFDPKARFQGERLQLAVKLWLLDVVRGVDRKSDATQADQLIIDSGLSEKLKGGEVRQARVA